MLRFSLACLAMALSPALVCAQGVVGPCTVFPARNVWNTPIDKLPVHRYSAQMIATEGADAPLHPDFGKNGAIPFSVVKADQPKVAISFDSTDESDPGPYPIPPDAPLENGADGHLIVVDQDNCTVYEVYAANKKDDGTWTGGSGAIFDLRNNALRPDGWTSADAAGLSIFAGLVRYDEAASGVIRHALRMTVPKTANYYVWPARHLASRLSGNQYPPMGQRFRLRADFDISKYDPIVQAILQALKTYGAMVADNGSAWFLTGAPDPRWDDQILAQLKDVKGSDLEAVDVSGLQGGPNSALAMDTEAPARVVVPFSATPAFDLSQAPTQSLTLTGDVTASNIGAARDGRTFTFLICQDDAGGHAFTWPSNVLGGMQVGTAPRACSAQTFVSDGTNLYATSPGMVNLPQSQ